MSVDSTGRLSPLFSPWIEALLAHERAIVPQSAGLRARALKRAHALVADGQGVSWSQPSWSGWHRVLFGSAAGVGLLISVALLYAASSHSAPSPVINMLLDSPGSRISSPFPETEAPSYPASPAEDRDREGAENAAAGDESSTEETVRQAPARDLIMDEVEMLERAQRSDTRSDFLAVLIIAAEHERLFPKGRLCEEREVLRLRALIGLKRSGEARQVARRFRRDYPHSVLLPALDEMLAPTL